MHYSSRQPTPADLPFNSSLDQERACEARFGARELRMRLAKFGDSYAGRIGGQKLNQSAKFWQGIRRADLIADTKGQAPA